MLINSLSFRVYNESCSTQRSAKISHNLTWQDRRVPTGTLEENSSMKRPLPEKIYGSLGMGAKDQPCGLRKEGGLGS